MVFWFQSLVSTLKWTLYSHPVWYELECHSALWFDITWLLTTNIANIAPERIYMYIFPRVVLVLGRVLVLQFWATKSQIASNVQETNRRLWIIEASGFFRGSLGQATLPMAYFQLTCFAAQVPLVVQWTNINLAAKVTVAKFAWHILV